MLVVVCLCVYSGAPVGLSCSGLECMLISQLGILYHTDKLGDHEWQWPVLRLWPQRQTCFSVIVRKVSLRFLVFFFFLKLRDLFFFFTFELNYLLINYFIYLINYFKCCMLSNISIYFWWGQSPVLCTVFSWFWILLTLFLQKFVED